MKINAQAIEISKHISVFVTDYAPTHLTSSTHTLRSYETALSLYVSYLEDVLKISSTDFTSKCFERKIIESWLPLWLCVPLLMVKKKRKEISRLIRLTYFLFWIYLLWTKVFTVSSLKKISQ